MASSLAPLRRSPLAPLGGVGLLLMGGLVGPWGAGCSWASTVQDNLQVVKDVQEGLEEAERTQPGVKFVIRPNTWFCPTAEQARASNGCSGGALLDINELIDTVGSAEEGGLWRVMYFDDTRPGGDGFVRADALGSSPELDRYRASQKAFQEEFPQKLRMSGDDRTPEVFLRKPEAVGGKVWLDSVQRGFIYDLTYATDGVSFWLPIRGAGQDGMEAFFYLRSERYVQRMGRHRYACTEGYCDEISFVAELQSFRYQPDDRPGPEEGFPVLRIIRFADRLDEYRIDADAPAPAPAPRASGDGGQAAGPPVDGAGPSKG